MQVLISKEPTVAGRVAVHVAGLEDELGLLKQLDHPNIVRYLVRAFSASALTPQYPTGADQHTSPLPLLLMKAFSVCFFCLIPNLSDVLLLYAGHRED